MPLPPLLYQSVFHALEEQIAVIDQDGRILDVNAAWRAFGTCNGLPADHIWTGRNYLETLKRSAASSDALAEVALQGIQGVLAGKLESFQLEYPCHSPEAQRWFTMRVTALHGEGVESLFVIAHHDVTHRKLAEEHAAALALQDPLTGLGNRRAFQMFLSKEMRRSVRTGAPIGLALIDVDHFKAYNDEHGHVAGDKCLTEVAQVLQAHARRPGGDLAARIGGDEFALILGNAELEMERKVAESVLKAIHELDLTFGGSRRVTVSIGLLTIVPDQDMSHGCLLKRVDQALYSAKSAGRNRVVHVRHGTRRMAPTFG